MATYYLYTIPNIRYERYAFFDGGATVVILEDDTAYKLSVNTRSEATVQAMGASSITETEYTNYVNNIEDFARIGTTPPQKPPAA